MTTMQGQTVICILRVKSGEERVLEELLKQHWPALDKAGLVTESAPTYFRGEEHGKPLIFEIFEWKNAEASMRAHEDCDIQTVWGSMDQLTEKRDGRPQMEFYHVEPM
jgi:hypothetical protein